MRNILLLLVLTLCALPLSAQVYRWVDDAGKVHYSDTPPPQANAQALDIDSAPQKSATKDGDDSANTSTAKNSSTPATLANKQCELAKMLLSTYRSAGALTKTDDKGNKQFLSKEETAATIARAEANVAAKCNPAQDTNNNDNGQP